MCTGTATYYVQCGHSAIEWLTCRIYRFTPCNRDPVGLPEEFRNESCKHRWCLASGTTWKCCSCKTLNKWGDCMGCKHVKCPQCAPVNNAPGARGHRFKDPRYVQWKRRYDMQERTRGILRGQGEENP
ncbi:hypothetical protein F4782DRAFT_530795 [Xylaria castorea]|nr:hypothetical protein F4782DRAFT_530795 [Xylaria castorea]